jgi:hypothetical protein
MGNQMLPELPDVVNYYVCLEPIISTKAKQLWVAFQMDTVFLRQRQIEHYGLVQAKKTLL